MRQRNPLFKAMLAAGLLGIAGSAAAVEIRIVNLDAGTGKGLDDSTPVAPVGGNPGKTRGEQTLLVYKYAAALWGSVLKGGVPITIDATFEPLDCTDGIPLGSARALSQSAFTRVGLPGGAKPDVWYHLALANALAGVDIRPDIADITMRFNSSLGSAQCGQGGGWYFGLDGNAPERQSNFLNVVLHEMAHGLGFSSLTLLASGDQRIGTDGVTRTDIFSSYIFDNVAGKKWDEMSSAERRLSARNDRHLVFTGPRVKADAPLVLGTRNVISVAAPRTVADDYDLVQASFGPPANAANFGGTVVRAATGGNAEGCTAFDNAKAVAGHIAMVDRGACSFVTKARHAEAAGATGVIVADNQVVQVLAVGGDVDAPVNIPVVGISRSNGRKFAANLAGLRVSLREVPAGIDASGNVQLYAPEMLKGGSSVSHFDTRLSPSALMEPYATPDLKGHLDLDLTPALFQDEGWRVNAGGQLLRTCDTGVPTWVPGGVVVGANIAATAKLLAGTSATEGAYAMAIRAHADKLAGDGLLTAAQTSSLAACLSDAEIAKQYENWRAGGADRPDVVDLSNGQTLAAQADAAGGERIYTLEVPAGARSLDIRTFGGVGDVSLYARAAGEPSASSYDYKSVRAGTRESIAVERPAAGTYFIKVVGSRDYAGVNVQATYRL